MIWTKFTIDTTTEVVDLLSDFLSERGIEGIMIEDNVPLSEDEIKQMFVDIPLELGEDDGTARVSCFLDDSYTEDKIEELKAAVQAELERLSEFLPVGCRTINVELTTDDSTWNDKFKENFRPARLYDNIVIIPVVDPDADMDEDRKNNYPDFEVEPGDKIIRIRTVTAFGTGTHETTRLCLGQVKKYMQEFSGEDISVFDVGCGSGILSIAARLMGASYVHGLDIDPQAVKASIINAEASGINDATLEFSCGNLLAGNRIAENYLNQGDNREKMKKASLGSGIATPLTPAQMVDIELGDADTVPARRYNIVVANILADVIIPLAEIIGDYLEENGVFIASGISEGKAEEVKAALARNGFTITDFVQENEWVAITSRKDI